MSCRGPTRTPEATPPEVGAGEAEVVEEAGAEAGKTGTAKIGTPSHLAMVHQWMVMLTPLALPTLG